MHLLNASIFHQDYFQPLLRQCISDTHTKRQECFTKTTTCRSFTICLLKHKWCYIIKLKWTCGQLIGIHFNKVGKKSDLETKNLTSIIWNHISGNILWSRENCENILSFIETCIHETVAGGVWRQCINGSDLCQPLHWVFMSCHFIMEITHLSLLNQQQAVDTVCRQAPL